MCVIHCYLLYFVRWDCLTKIKIEMKLFVAEKREQGYVSETDYHWCNDGDILMFGQFQTEENRKGNEVSMFGIQSRKFTTHILVKDLEILKEFLLELITESVEKAMNCEVNDDGSYTIDLGEEWNMKFNINDILTELTEKAGEFKDGEKVICRGRVLTSVGEKVNYAIEKRIFNLKQNQK